MRSVLLASALLCSCGSETATVPVVVKNAWSSSLMVSVGHAEDPQFADLTEVFFLVRVAVGASIIGSAIIDPGVATGFAVSADWEDQRCENLNVFSTCSRDWTPGPFIHDGDGPSVEFEIRSNDDPYEPEIYTTTVGFR